MNGCGPSVLLSFCALVTLLGAAGSSLGAAVAKRTAQDAGTATPGLVMDYGPFLSSSVLAPGSQHPDSATLLAAKGLTIRVGNNASVCFDTGLLRMAAGWSGGFLDISRTHLASLKGSTAPVAQGRLEFQTRAAPGWSQAGKPVANRYAGLYRCGGKVVLSYSVGGARVLELPGSFTSGGHLAFTRTLRIEPTKQPLSLMLCAGDEPGGGVRPLDHLDNSSNSTSGAAGQVAAVVQTAGGVTAVAVIGAPKGSSLKISEGPGARLDLPALTTAQTFRVVIATLPPAKIAEFANLVAAAPPAEDLPALCRGGPALWKADVATEGVSSRGADAYLVDTITLPEDNPWHSWMRPSGLDFFPDGRCALCTMNGDVWIVAGLDSELQHVTWKRFATGLYEPLGLRIVDGQIYVLGRDQITRLHDLNDDGEADFYENFNNDCVTAPQYHGFHLDLQTDSKGNFYYAVDGNGVPPNVPMHACIVKVPKDGSKSEVYATGLRVAAGLGMGPGDELVCSDNQGNWTPVCRINLIQPGGFYGFNGDPKFLSQSDIAAARKSYDPPICWIPYEKDNSSGGQVFVTGGKWGPLEGRMLSTSYGKCKLFEVLEETNEGVVQGASVEMPLQFLSGLLRGRFNPADGQLYVCGLKGWQTSAVKDGCLQRVRYTGKAVRLPTEFHVQKDGIAITFACGLDPQSASDEQNYGASQWNYRWSAKYGSDKYKPGHPGQVGTDDLDVTTAKLQPDGKTVILQIPGLQPVMQMAVQVHVNAADGSPIECEIDATINHVPGSSLPPVLTAP